MTSHGVVRNNISLETMRINRSQSTVQRSFYLAIALQDIHRLPCYERALFSLWFFP